jgi:hypothetical protein
MSTGGGSYVRLRFGPVPEHSVSQDVGVARSFDCLAGW